VASSTRPGGFFPLFLVKGRIPTSTRKWDGRRDRIYAVIISLPIGQRDVERCGMASLNIGEMLVVAAAHTSSYPGKPT
jgi:hypothetical protein